MGLELKHKKLDVWQQSVEFAAKIYRITANFPNSEIYGLSSQMRRAAISVPSNISEGSARSSKSERRRFYEIARFSLVEVDTQLDMCSILNYISDEQMQPLNRDFNSIFALISNLIKKT